MANFGSAVAKSDGIACLLRRFETHIDTGGVFTRLPEKAYRAGSIRGQRDVHKIIDRPALEPIDQSHPFIPTPNGNKLIVESSSESTQSPVLSSPTSAVNLSKLASAGEMKVSDKGGISSQQAAAGGGGTAGRMNSMDETETDKSLASSLTTQTGSSSDPSQDSISTPRSSEANLPRAVENDGRFQFPSSEDGSAASKVPISSSKNSRSMNELDAAERKAAKGREAASAVATRFIFKQSSRENQNGIVYLDDTSSSSLPSTSNKVKQLARSMDNICSNSAASTPTKERNIFHVDKSAPRVGKWSDNSSPSTAPAAIPSLANDERAAVARAKKPPPVPKKNSKVGREAEGRELNSVSGGQSDAKPTTGESQTMPNLSQIKKPAARPTTLFPDHQVADHDGDGGGGSSSGDEIDDDARHKSLPILGSSKDGGGGRDEPQLLPTNAPKNTLFPCNRQKTRTRILSTETNSTDDQGSLPYSLFVTSPMSLGTRTPPDIESIVDNSFSDKKYSSEQNSTAAGNAFTRSRSSDQLLSVASTTAAANDVFDSHEAFDPDSFLSDAFDFLGSSNSAESETKTSPLKSWTDTWRKASQKRLSKASDRFAEVAGSSSREYRTTEGDRKEPTGNLPDKTKQQDETTAKITSTGTNHLSVGLNKTSNAPMKSTGRGEKTKTGDDAEPPTTTHFGVVLRRTDAPSSLFRRSSIASLVSNENPSALTKKANARHESFVSRPVSIRKSTESFRTSDRTSVNLNRKPSMVSAGTSALPLTAAVPPSQKPTHRSSLFGRNIVGRASSTLNRTSVQGDSNGTAEVVVGARGSRQSTSGNKLQSELNDIDRAFMFLDRS